MARFKGVFLAALFLANALSINAYASEVDFKTANQLYRSGKYREAARAYDALIKREPASSVLYYNLANSHFRLNEIGQAVLAYERALVLEPRNQDIRRNLEFARTQLDVKVKDKRNWYLKTAELILGYIRYDEILFVFMLLFALMLLSVLIGMISKQSLALAGAAKLFLLLAMTFGVILGAKAFESRVTHHAIILQKDAEVHFGPSDSDQIALRLSEGLKVYVIDENDDWYRISLMSGDEGWIRKNQLGLVEIFDKGIF